MPLAQIAAAAPVLDAKRQVTYRELETQSWFTRVDSDRVPFTWTLNPYRGCEFACRYCYARYTHEFMDLNPSSDFDSRIFAKRWSASAFASELRRIPRDQPIGLGTATDPYQPAERRYELTRRILEILEQDWGRRIYLTTKSDLVARDADLLSAVNRRNRLIVSLTVTTTNTDLARILEPKAPRPDLRIGAVSRLSQAGVPAGVGMSPIMPGINDSRPSMESVAQAAASAKAFSFHGYALFLKPCSKPVFFETLKARFPWLAARYQALYASGAFLHGAYPEMIRNRIRNLRDRYALHGEESNLPPLYQPQLDLFAA
jgi:DNA repair photolyase